MRIISVLEGATSQLLLWYNLPWSSLFLDIPENLLNFLLLADRVGIYALG